MSEFKYKEGESVYLGKFRGFFRIEERVSNYLHDEIYQVEGVVGDAFRDKTFRAKFSTFDISYLGELSVIDYIEHIEAAKEKLHRINIPNLARIIDFSAEESDGSVRTCLITEYIERPSLAEEMAFPLSGKEFRSRRMEGARLKNLMISLCDIIKPLHQENLIFANLKPTNIFADEKGAVKLTDIDISGSIGEQRGRHEGKENPLSQLWLSPEQLKPEINHVGPESDIWSIGIILYQLLSESYPFNGQSMEDLVHNISAPQVHRNTISYLPSSLDNILDVCLKKDFKDRCNSLDLLKRYLETAEFIKPCAAGHPNQYWNLHCVDETCSLSFSKPGDMKGYRVHDGWIEYPEDIDELIPVDEYRDFQIYIHPKYHPESFQLQNEGSELKIRLKSQDDKSLYDEFFSVQLHPVPKFDISNKNIDIEKDRLESGEPIEIGLILERSRVSIENIEILVDGNSGIASINPSINPGLFRTNLDAQARPYPMMINVDPEKVFTIHNPDDDQKKDYYEISIVIKFENRSNPLMLDASTLRVPIKLKVVNKPKLEILEYPKKKPILIETYSGSNRPYEDTLWCANIGDGSLWIERVYAYDPADECEIVHQPFIDFGEINPALSVGTSEAPFRLNYRIYNQRLLNQSVDFILRFEIRGEYNGKIFKDQISRRCIIEQRDLKGGRLMAIDFGTTNTTCAVLKTELTYKSVEILSLPSDVSENQITPSVIEYFSRFHGTRIGVYPQILHGEGNINIFRSFKRRIGSNEPYPIIPPLRKGKFKRKPAEELCKDYLRIIYELAEQRLGYTFNSFVFTHPTLFSHRKRKKFRELLINAGFINPIFLDEATAGALNYIHDHQGKYNLIVYDFGGGTIDITCLDVQYVPNQEIKIEVKDAGGLNNFGGDDVTESIMDLIIHRVMEDTEEIEILLPNSTRYKRLPDFEKVEADKNKRRLWNFVENRKKKPFFDNEVSEDTLPRLCIWNKIKSRAEFRDNLRFTIVRQDIYKNIYEKIKESIDIVSTMIKSDIDRNETDTDRYILLSGQSCQIPLVKIFFEEYQKGNIPIFQKDSEDNSELAFLEDDILVSHMKYSKAPDFARELKECVCKGAVIYFLAMQKNLPINIYGRDNITRHRFGMLKVIGLLNSDKFDEWIPKNRFLMKYDRKIDKFDPMGMIDFAIEERPCDFSFIASHEGQYQLEWPIDVYENLGGQDDYDQVSMELYGTFSFTKPDDYPIDINQIRGLLRMEIMEDHVVRLRAKFDGSEEWKTADLLNVQHEL